MLKTACLINFFFNSFFFLIFIILTDELSYLISNEYSYKAKYVDVNCARDRRVVVCIYTCIYMLHCAFQILIKIKSNNMMKSSFL